MHYRDPSCSVEAATGEGRIEGVSENTILNHTCSVEAATGEGRNEGVAENKSLCETPPPNPFKMCSGSDLTHLD